MAQNNLNNLKNEVIDFNNVIPNILCDEIIKKFENSENKSKKYKNKTILSNNSFNFEQFEIPKQDNEWKKIEIMIYKQLLIHLNKYKQQIFDINNLGTNNFLNVLFNTNLYLTSYHIQKYSPKENSVYIEDFNKIHSRYNCFTFVYFLNSNDEAEITIDTKNNIIPIAIKPRKGNLVIYTENIDNKYTYKLPLLRDNLYINTRQLYKKKKKKKL